MSEVFIKVHHEPKAEPQLHPFEHYESQPVETPNIKIVPEPVVQPQPEVKEEEKTVGSMTATEFSEVLLDAMVRANYIMKQQEANMENEFDNGKPRNAIQNVLHTIGGVGHGIVDIAEGVCRGAVDLLTFGQSKR